MRQHYQLNEVFYSLQGEGKRAGCPSVFVRFAKCNLKCTMEPGDKSPGGFDCDTEFESGRKVTLDEIHEWIKRELAGRPCKWLVLTGGEPALQVDAQFCDYFHALGFKLAIETNGSIALPTHSDSLLAGELYLDWITVSPKVAEHNIRQTWAHEVKYVRGYGQAIPQTCVQAQHKLISPATNGSLIDKGVVEWCINLVKENPEWDLSVQLHKDWMVR